MSNRSGLERGCGGVEVREAPKGYISDETRTSGRS